MADSGILHLDNAEQLPSDRVLEAWVQRDGEVEAVEALFSKRGESQAWVGRREAGKGAHSRA